MRHIRFSAFFAVSALAMLLITGCSKDDPVDANENEEALFLSYGAGNETDTKDAFVTDMEALDETQELKALISGLRKSTAAPVTPIRWGRRIDSVRRVLLRPIVKQGDTIAIATVQTTFNGRFIVQALSGVDTVVIQKPYTEIVSRSLRFERIAHTNRPRLNWRLDAINVLSGGTGDPLMPTIRNIAIQQVEVVLPNETLTVTDPTTYFMQFNRRWLRGLPVLNNLQVTLRVTVLSEKSEADIVTLHKLPGAFGLHHTPLTMVSETQSGSKYLRVFEHTWTISGSAKKYANLMVSATTKESLYDNATTNFSSVVWGIPYKHSN